MKTVGTIIEEWWCTIINRNLFLVELSTGELYLAIECEQCYAMINLAETEHNCPCSPNTD